ncbi:MAG: GNAT family N-acetyltransferase [Nostocaceae cyanobacterium]|nr:GNAT family N-acetyltransferase [Nostocaceae cyanobacterium]
MKIFLETERLILRQFTESDADNLFTLDDDSQIMRYINGGYPTEYTTIQEKILPRFLSYYDKYENYGIWAAIEKSSQEFIGWFHFFPAIENTFAVELNLVTEDEIALGYRLKKAHWGKGYATEGSLSLINNGFSQWNVNRVIAWALKVNKPSIRVMEKVGLKLEQQFTFTQTQLPNLPANELPAVKYGVSQLREIPEEITNHR